MIATAFDRLKRAVLTYHQGRPEPGAAAGALTAEAGIADLRAAYADLTADGLLVETDGPPTWVMDRLGQRHQLPRFAPAPAAPVARAS